MADRYSERGRQRWGDDRERRFRDREYDFSDRGFLERFADEMRSWFGNEEAQRRRMMDEREDWRGERGSGDWGWRDRGRSDWGRGEWTRGESRPSEWMRGPEERQWSREWGWVEGRDRDYPRGGYGAGSYGSGSGAMGGYGTSGSGSYGSGSYGSGSYGSGTGYGAGGYGTTGYGGYGAWGRERDWEQPRRESRDYGSRDVTSGPHSGRGPRGYQRADERIREDVCERLTHHAYLDPSDIEIRVQNGAVTLEGTVSDRWAKRTAEDLAEGVSGVREVHNQLRVTSQTDLGQTTGEIRDDQQRPGPQRGTWAA